VKQANRHGRSSCPTAGTWRIAAAHRPGGLIGTLQARVRSPRSPASLNVILPTDAACVRPPTRCGVTALKVAKNQISKRGRSGLVRPDSGGAAGEVSLVQLDREGTGDAARGSCHERGPGDRPAAAQGAHDDLRRALQLHPPETTSTTARTASQGILVAISPTASPATTTTAGTRSFPPGRATLTAPGTSASAPASTAAWARARCSRRDAR
jgi:hypothetical protein